MAAANLTGRPLAALQMVAAVTTNKVAKAAQGVITMAGTAGTPPPGPTVADMATTGHRIAHVHPVTATGPILAGALMSREPVAGLRAHRAAAGSAPTAAVPAVRAQIPLAAGKAATDHGAARISAAIGKAATDRSAAAGKAATGRSALMDPSGVQGRVALTGRSVNGRNAATAKAAAGRAAVGGHRAARGLATTGLRAAAAARARRLRPASGYDRPSGHDRASAAGGPARADRPSGSRGGRPDRAGQEVQAGLVQAPDQAVPAALVLPAEQIRAAATAELPESMRTGQSMTTCRWICPIASPRTS